MNSVDDVTALLEADATCTESMRKRIESISSMGVYRNPKEFVGAWVDLDVKGEN
jgi:hypothetical protein